MANMIVINAMIEENGRHSANKERVYRNRTRYLDLCNDQEIRIRYRMSRAAIEQLIDIVRPRLQRDTRRSFALDAETQFLVTLRYLAKGGFQSELADLHGITQPSVSRSISSCLNALIEILDFISFPKGNEALVDVKAGFYQIAGFPRVIGAIDGTLVSILRPRRDEEAYVCRKGFHAVNVQAICDANLRFTNVVCKWPGSTHDSFILANSKIGAKLNDRGDADGWLLGDSGYACKPWLLTPFVNPTTPSEESYNKAHIKTRNTVERAFGLLKSRFRCLHKTTGCIPFNPQKANKVIYVACQLHNFCINLNEPMPEYLEEEDDADENPYQGPNAPDGYAVRRKLVQDVFT